MANIGNIFMQQKKGLFYSNLFRILPESPTTIVRNKGTEQNWNEGSEWKIIGCFDTVNIEI